MKKETERKNGNESFAYFLCRVCVCVSLLSLSVSL